MRFKLFSEIPICAFVAIGFFGTSSCATAQPFDIVVNAAPAASAVEVSDAFDAAIEEARRERTRDPNARVTIRIRPGTYHLARPIVLGTADSGRPDAPLVIQGDDGAAVRLLGSIPVRMVAATGVDRVSRAPVMLRRDLIRISLHPSTIGDGVTALHRIFGQATNGVPIVLSQGVRPLSVARWPSIGYASAYAVLAGPQADRQPVFTAPSVGRWAGEGGLWAGGFWAYDWAYESAQVRNVDVGSHTIILAPLQTSFPLAKKFRFSILNSAADLGPGSYIIDEKSKSLIVLPFDSPNSSPIELSTLRTLLLVRAAHDIIWKGISLENATGDAVVIQDSQRIALSDGLVANVGADGVRVSGGGDNIVERYAVVDVGETGILLSGGDRETLRPANHRVRDSIIVHFGKLARTYAAGVELQGVADAVEGSYVAHGPHMAIRFSGNEHSILRNEVADVLTDVGDAGVIYAGRDVMARGNLISGNYIHNISVGSPPRDVRGIYLDDFLSGSMVSANLFVGVRQSIYLNGGSDTKIAGNVFVSPSGALVTVRDASQDWEVMQPDIKRHDLVPLKGFSLYMQRYDGAGSAFEAPHIPRRNTVVDSIIISSTPGTPQSGSNAFRPPSLSTGAAWVLGSAATPEEVCAVVRDSGRKISSDFPCHAPATNLRTLRYAGRAGL